MTDDLTLAFKSGLTLEGGVDNLMKHTHDELIEQTGAARASGVQWRIVRGRYDVLAWLHRTWSPEAVALGDVPETVVLAFRDQARAMIREHGDQVVVVVAECMVRKP